VCPLPRKPRARVTLHDRRIIVDQHPFNAPEDLVHVAYAETALRHKVKDAGGQWDRELKLWRIPRAAVRTLGLADRVVKRA
jgi:hypothetical protein